MDGFQSGWEGSLHVQSDRHCATTTECVSEEEDAMKKFMVLYMASSADFERAMKNATPEQHKKGMDGWMKWMEKNKKSIIDGGAPLGKTKRVDGKGTSNTKNGVGGYSIVQAQSHDAAAKLF